MMDSKHEVINMIFIFLDQQTSFKYPQHFGIINR